MSISRISALFAAIFFLLSCSAFGPAAHVDVLIPAPPPHWTQAFPDLEFRLVFADPAGRTQVVRVANPGAAVAIDCSKEGNTPILAYPCRAGDREGELDKAGSLRPAGGIYPSSLDASGSRPALLLHWEDGAAATVLFRLLTLGRDTSLVNATRLLQYFRVEQDPWILDLELIEEKLAAGKFTAYDIDKLPRRDVRVQAGSGEWFTESPFSSVTSQAGEEALGLPGLSLGMHGLFSTDGRLMMIDVGANETATLWIR